uniref:Uncharacterized protein n=1 Tax=viral metagenome TaxID=1070528 RepID=A0A6C0K165_9ZZZZ
MAFERLYEEYFLAYNATKDLCDYAPGGEEARSNYIRAREEEWAIQRSFDEITRLHDSTSEVYIQREKQCLAAREVTKNAADVWSPYARILYKNFEIREISGIAKQAYNRAVKMRMEVFFKFRKLRT